ncbi:MAG TPA: hypothetical protein VFC98_05770 [Clostridia bacterium]|nr:hypothetical protein [Clostridia bacterium]
MGPPTITVAILIAYPTDTPTVLPGMGINNDSTTIDRTAQNINNLNSGILKLKSEYMYMIAAIIAINHK